MSTSGRKKRHVEEEHENSERWLVTYADMLTVLMALFIVMFALSVVDKKKFEEFANGLNDKPGAGTSFLAGGDGLLVAPSSAMTLDVEAAKQALEEKQRREADALRETSDLTEAQEKIREALVERGMEGSVRFRIDERGLVVTVVTDDVLFELGSATLMPAGTSVLDAIAPALVSLPNQITVEGHTDNLPISPGGRFATNWELSTERATSVLRYMLDRHTVAPQRLSAAGYADQRPLGPNTPAGRSANRRVEVIVRAQTPVAVDPASTTPAGAAPAGTAQAPPPADTPVAAAAPDEERN